MNFKSITYAGHSAVMIKTDSLTIGVDPWLEGNPVCPKNLKNPEALDLIVLTHGHSDHAGDAIRLAKHYGSTVAATYELAMILISEGLPGHLAIPMNKGGSVQHKGITITLTHAYHSSSYDTASGPVYAGEACGVVLADSRRSIYHAGDTALFADMSLIRELYAPEIAMLPIGDRFTMGPAEAARAAKLVGARKILPIHYGTFDLLTGTPPELEKHLEGGIEMINLEPGQSADI